jgi:hypothetical protein
MGIYSACGFLCSGCGMDSIFIFLDRIYRIDGIFFACGERPFGRRPLYPDDLVDPVQFLFKKK